MAHETLLGGRTRLRLRQDRIGRLRIQGVAGSTAEFSILWMDEAALLYEHPT